jgi:16S rRNA (cytosine1402-N4)-methyltransferase
LNQARRHVPVLMKEVLWALAPERAKDRPSLWLDGTLGMAGHATAVMERAGEGARLLGLDKDTQALALAAQALAPFGTRVRLVHGSYAGAVEEARAFVDKAAGFDGILLDLGVSSLQLDSPERGFSFMKEGPLDMRLDASQGMSAGDYLARVDEAGLKQALRDLGEEREAGRLARAVLRAQGEGALKTTVDLAGVAERVLGRRKPGEIHPATRLFQALRLAVNAELEALDKGLPDLAGLLAPGGRLVVISFHSLEDRRVKDYFKRESQDCICPPGLPECRCGHKASLRLLTRKPLEADEAETAENPRSRSAKLRAAEKI